jgi:phosphoesterase RecJ-like protein
MSSRPQTADWPRFVELVRSHRRFLLTTHVRPDGDALGSQLAMAAILEQLGKEVLTVNSFATPPKYQFLDPQGRLKQLGTDVSVAQLGRCEVLMVLDTSAWAQLGLMGEVIRSTAAKIMVMDHHVSGDDLGGEVLKNEEAEATGRLVMEAADLLGAKLTPDIAQALFVALATDTGWFRFSSTTKETLCLAARLAEAGARPDHLYQQLHETDSLARLQLIGRAMARVRAELDGRLIHTFIDRTDFAATGADPSDSEEMINMLMSVAGSEAAVMLVEQDDGTIRVSLRSRFELDCSRVAEQLGGGGHRKAAGALLEEPLDAAQAKVLDAVRAAL